MEKMNPFAEQEAWEEHQIGILFVVINLFSIFSSFNSVVHGFVKQSSFVSSGKAAFKFGSKDRKKAAEDYE